MTGAVLGRSAPAVVFHAARDLLKQPRQGQGHPGAAVVAEPTQSGPASSNRSAAAVARRVAPPLVAAAVMAVFGVIGLGRHGAMGNDEVASHWAAQLPAHQLRHLLSHVDAVHGLYYILLHVWTVVGSSPTVMRIPSVAAMTVAVGVVVCLGQRVTGSTGEGLLAGLVMALTPSISFYAQTGRSYAMVFCAVALATLLLVRALDAEGRSVASSTGRWVWYGVVVVVAAYLNELALLVLVAHGATVLLARAGRRAAVHWLIAAGTSVVLVLPLIIVSRAQDSVLLGLPRPGLRDLQTLLHDYFGAATVVALLFGVCALVAVLPERHDVDRQSGAVDAAVDVSVPHVSPPRTTTTVATIGLPLLVLPALVLITESAVAKPLYFDRYVLFGEIGAALLIGAGLARMGRILGEATSRPILVAVPGTLACIAALVLQLGVQRHIRTPQSRQFDFGSPARFIAANARPGDGVLFFDDFFRKAELGYPAQFRSTRDIALASAPAQTGDFRGRNKPFPSVRPIMLRYPRLWVFGMPAARALDDAGPNVRAQAALLISRFRQVASRRYGRITVTLCLPR